MQPSHQRIFAALGASLDALRRRRRARRSVGSSCNLDPVAPRRREQPRRRAGRSLPAGEPSTIAPASRARSVIRTRVRPTRVFVLARHDLLGPRPLRPSRRPGVRAHRRSRQDDASCFVTNCNGNFYVTPRGLQEPQVPAAHLRRAREQPRRCRARTTRSRSASAACRATSAARPRARRVTSSGSATSARPARSACTTRRARSTPRSRRSRRTVRTTPRASAACPEDRL